MSRIGSFVWLFVAVPTLAQPVTKLEQINAIERQAEDFYGAIAGTGPRVAIEWTLQPLTIERGQTAILTLTVSNAVNPTELIRPNLRDRDEFKELFEVVEDLPVLKPGVFRYGLKPRKEGSITILLPRYRFYLPPLPEGRRFQTVSVEPPVLNVGSPKTIVTPQAVVPISAPEHYFVLPIRDDTLAIEPPTILWLALITLTIIISILWIIIWRKLYPNAVELARIRKIHAVRVALKQLQSADAGVVSLAFRQYLVERLGVPQTAQTPREVRSNMNLPAEFADTAERILRTCDEQRFSPTVSQSNVADQAREWILRWEGGQAS